MEHGGCGTPLPRWRPCGVTPRSVEPGLSRTRRQAQVRTRMSLPRRAGQLERGVGAVADPFPRRATAVVALCGVRGRAELS